MAAPAACSSNTSKNALAEVKLENGLPTNIFDRFNSNEFTKAQITNVFLRELAQSPHLTHLNLTSYIETDPTEELDFGILAKCHLLKSFAPSYRGTEDDLYATILSNPNLTDLDLKKCNNSCLSARVFHAVRQLEHLRVFEVGRFRPKFPAPLLNGLIQCTKLEKFTLTTTPLPEGFLEGWSSLTKLKHLDLEYGQGLSPTILMRITHLTSLEQLELLSVIEVNDAIVKAIVDHCTKLKIFTIGGDREDDGKPLLGEIDLTQESLNSIQTAILERRSTLTKLTVGIMGTKITYEMLVQLKENVSKEVPSFQFFVFFRSVEGDDWEE